MEMAPLSDHYVSSSVNKFYAIGNKIVVNASVFMDSSPETQSVTVRPTLQKQLSYIIQQRNNNLGMSRLWVEGNSNPVTTILGLFQLFHYVVGLSILIKNCRFRFEWMRLAGTEWLQYRRRVHQHSGKFLVPVQSRILRSLPQWPVSVGSTVQLVH